MVNDFDAWSRDRNGLSLNDYLELFADAIEEDPMLLLQLINDRNRRHAAKARWQKHLASEGSNDE